ncbi:MAG: hypothetical protein FJ147_00680 [Deltaproteobacteria bacterium]|nr:hypothetical protein [Deltaproteobacteria bacterium]
MNLYRIATLVIVPWLGLLTATSSSFGETSQPATVIAASPEQAQQQAPLFTFLQGYFSSLAQGEVNKLAQYHPTLTTEQLSTLQGYFSHTIRDLHIDVRNVQVQLTANTATVSFFRTDRFIDRLTERQIEKSIQLSTVLEYGANGWRLGGLDQVAFALVPRTTQAG